MLYRMVVPEASGASTPACWSAAGTMLRNPNGCRCVGLLTTYRPGVVAGQGHFGLGVCTNLR